jgi:glycosyltransferase involved in cell wall biosynthesis
MRRLKIGQISPLNLPIPPKKYGGTERIVFWLCEELKKLGHEVFLFGTKDSKVSCKLIPIIDKALWKDKKIKEHGPYYALEMVIVSEMANKLKLDILHDHLGPWSLTLYGKFKTPILHTLHVPFEGREDRVFVYQKLKSKLISISFSQRKPAPNLNYVANVYNGIDVSQFPFNRKPKNYFIWVGELSKRKGILEVIEIAKRAKINLYLAGRIPPPQQREDYQFFKIFIEKKLNKGKIKYLGELSHKKLSFYYKNAIAFLYPLQWEEPFGLTMIESMASGTPVIAFERGSVPELVKDKLTGFVIKPYKKGKQNFEDFISALEVVSNIKRENCREWVEKKFTKEKMAKEYERVYYRTLNG